METDRTSFSLRESSVIIKSLLLASIIVFSGCTTEKTELPPERPQNTINGIAIDGRMIESSVSVFSFANGQKGKRLGSGDTNTLGEINADVSGASQVILIEVTAGSYIEQASGKTVSLAPGQVLRGLAKYVSGENIDHVTVSSLTHLITALTEYHVSTGQSVNQALETANNTINQFFSITSVAELAASQTIPVDLQTSNADLLDGQSLYAFYLAAMSNWTAWASSKKNELAHESLTTISLLQLMYEDIAADGVLDGMGSEPVSLSFGDAVTMDTDQYRAMFSIHLQAAANLPINQTQLTNGDLETAALTIAGKASDVLGEGAPVLDIVAAQNPEPSLGVLNAYFHGNSQIIVNVDGFLPPKRIRWRIESEDPNWIAIDNPLTPEIEIDTRQYDDNTYDISVEITDQLDNVATNSFPISIDNTLPSLTVDDNESVTSTNAVPPVIPAVSTNTVLTGTFTDVFAGVQAVGIRMGVLDTDPVVYAELDHDFDTWRAEIQVNSGTNTVEFFAVDNAGNMSNPLQSQIYLDDIAPTVTVLKYGSTFFVGNNDPQPIEQINVVPFLIDPDHVMLTVEPDSDILDGLHIPYFKLKVEDKRLQAPVPGYDISEFNKIKNLQPVQVVYTRNDVVQEVDQEIIQLSSSCDELLACSYTYVIVGDYLSSGWQSAGEGVRQELLVTFTDPAGNTSQFGFEFKAIVEPAVVP